MGVLGRPEALLAGGRALLATLSAAEAGRLQGTQLASRQGYHLPLRQEPQPWWVLPERWRRLPSRQTWLLQVLWPTPSPKIEQCSAIIETKGRAATSPSTGSKRRRSCLLPWIQCSQQGSLRRSRCRSCDKCLQSDSTS